MAAVMPPGQQGENQRFALLLLDSQLRQGTHLQAAAAAA
jgi:hypothetical protein